jgi:ADP-ribose pyrophosphatase YjhB (NUDIX family)
MNDAKYDVGQSGAIACRVTNGQLHILVVSPKEESGVWIFPKGHVENNESFSAAALRECREEAGVDGVVIAPVGNPLEFRSKDEHVWVQYFLIRMTDYVPTNERRQRRWLPISDALSTLSHEDARKLLESERPRLERLVLASMDPDGAFRDYLLHEFDHLGESLSANEEERETLVDTLLVGMLAALVVPRGWRWRWRAIVGVTSASIAWVALIKHANSRYKTEMSE